MEVFAFMLTEKRSYCSVMTKKVAIHIPKISDQQQPSPRFTLFLYKGICRFAVLFQSVLFSSALTLFYAAKLLTLSLTLTLTLLDQVKYIIQQSTLVKLYLKGHRNIRPPFARPVPWGGLITRVDLIRVNSQVSLKKRGSAPGVMKNTIPKPKLENYKQNYSTPPKQRANFTRQGKFYRKPYRVGNCFRRKILSKENSNFF